MITKFEYKGFNIYELTDGRLYPQNKGDAKFKNEGYATLNAAKVAITKQIQAIEEEKKSALQEVPEPCDLCGTAFGKYGCGCILEQEAKISSDQSRNKREGKYAGKFRQYAGLTIYGDKMYSKNPRGKKSHHYRDQRKSFQLT